RGGKWAGGSIGWQLRAGLGKRVLSSGKRKGPGASRCARPEATNNRGVNHMTANKIPNVVPDATEPQAPATEPQTVVPETTEPQAPAPDPFNPTNLRLSQSFVETAGVKKLLTTVPVRKPSRQDFVRVHPDPAYRE